MILDEEKGLYTIGTTAEIIGVHPETLRVWEKNELIKPKRDGVQRRYTNNDLKRLKFIKYMIGQKGLNVAGIAYLITSYPCWFHQNCSGGASKSSKAPVNPVKPCWKAEDTYCLLPIDKAEMCAQCIHCKKL